MGGSVGTAPVPPLPYRARPPQVLLGVGAVLLVSAGAAVASAHGGTPIRLLLLAVAVALAGFSLRSARARLRSSEETLAASAAGLALAGSDLAGAMPAGDPVTPAALVVPFLVLQRVAPTTAVWPLAAWAAGQLAVLRALDLLPQQLRTETCLAVALVGLGIALFGRRIVARLALPPRPRRAGPLRTSPPGPAARCAPARRSHPRATARWPTPASPPPRSRPPPPAGARPRPTRPRAPCSPSPGRAAAGAPCAGPRGARRPRRPGSRSRWG